MSSSVNAYRVVDLISGAERYFKFATTMCDGMGWDNQQFRNHKSKSKNKDLFIYKEFRVERIKIE